MTKWIEEKGPDGDIVISSRIRLARNLEDFSFPGIINKEKGKEIIETVNHAIKDTNNFNLILLDEISPLERQVFMEKRLISPHLINNFEKSAVFLNKQESISIMINEEDHLRIQCLLSGFQLNEAYTIANETDDFLEENLKYAFDEELGYLTCCPTNLGTGLRASVMLDLSGLVMTGYINRILQAASQMGLTIRGIYGEGTESVGNIFQISNQLTLGRSEEEIIGNVKDVTRQIIQKEREIRNAIFEKNPFQLEDRVFRSFGTLKHARILTSKECMKLLSDIRLGVNLRILKDIKIDKINQIMVMTQPAYLQKIANTSLEPNERDIKRASLVREKLENIME